MVMVSLLILSSANRGLDPWLGHTEVFKTCISSYSTDHEAFIMYQNGVKYLYTDCCFSDLELKINPAYKRVGLVQSGHLHSPIVTCSHHYILYN